VIEGKGQERGYLLEFASYIELLYSFHGICNGTRFVGHVNEVCIDLLRYFISNFVTRRVDQSIRDQLSMQLGSRSSL
jgi:hypothetical protein